MIAHFSPFVKTANFRIRGLFCLPLLFVWDAQNRTVKIVYCGMALLFHICYKINQYDIRQNFAQNVNIHVEWDNIATLQNAQNML